MRYRLFCLAFVLAASAGRSEPLVAANPSCAEGLAGQNQKPAFLAEDFPIEDHFFFAQFKSGSTRSEIQRLQSQFFPEIEKYYSSRAESLDPGRIRAGNIGFRAGGVQMFKIKDVFPDFNSDTDLMIGIEDNANEHINLIAGDVRFDGGGPITTWSPHQDVRLQNLGTVLLFKGLPKATIDQLKKRIMEYEKIYDLSCWAATLRVLESYSDLRLQRKDPNNPLLPGEILLLLLEGRLTDSSGRHYIPRIATVGGKPFSEVLKRIADSGYAWLTEHIIFWLSDQKTSPIVRQILSEAYGHPLTGAEIRGIGERLAR